MRNITLRTISVLALFAAAISAAPLPRQAADFTATLPGGKQLRLSDYRGKVICLEFIFTTCVHCQHTSQLTTKLQGEYGPKGFQALGVAFNDMAGMLVPDFVRDFKVSYPVGWSAREPVQAFLQHNPDYALHVPQVVIIDRKGMIRVQSQAQGDGVTATEANLRKNIEEMLKEPAPAVSKRSPGPTKKAAATVRAER